MSKIYLISPPKIDNLDNFLNRLDNALSTKLIEVFQLRIKDIDYQDLKEIAIKTKEICQKNRCLLIINDNSNLAIEIGAGGVHLGEKDGNIQEIRKKASNNFVIGVSCYDSKHLAIEAGEAGADYISFGTFFSSPTKNSKGRPNIDIIEWADEILNLPIIAIGGINQENCSKLVKSGADFLAVVSYVWDHKQGEIIAIKNLDQAIKQAANE